jgi:hypothetical protein
VAEQIAANDGTGPFVRYELVIRFPHDDGNVSEYGQMDASKAAETLRVHAAMLDSLSGSVEARPPTLAETRTGIDWCPRCQEEAGTNRYLVTRHEYCGTCGAQLRPIPASVEAGATEEEVEPCGVTGSIHGDRHPCVKPAGHYPHNDGMGCSWVNEGDVVEAGATEPEPEQAPHFMHTQDAIEDALRGADYGDLPGLTDIVYVAAEAAREALGVCGVCGSGQPGEFPTDPSADGYAGPEECSACDGTGWTRALAGAGAPTEPNPACAERVPGCTRRRSHQHTPINVVGAPTEPADDTQETDHG